MTTLVDLSQTIVSGRPGYPGLFAPRIEPYISHAASLSRYDGQAVFEITRLFLVGNTGTYLDSPYHRYPDGDDIATLPLEAVAGLPAIRPDAEIGEDGRTVEAGSGMLAAAADLRGAALPVRRTSAWRRLAKRTVEAHVTVHGWRCPGWHREPHPLRPGELTADHPVPLVRGGVPLPVRPGVLCASYNARKGLSERRR